MILKSGKLALKSCSLCSLKWTRQSIGFTQLINKRRSNSTLAITPANKIELNEKQVNSQVIEEPESLESNNLSDYLNRYKTLFAKDIITNSQIKTYQEVNLAQQNQVIKIGIIYDDEITAKNSKIIDTILSDPLSKGNESWFKSIVERQRVDNIKFSYGSEEAEPNLHSKNELQVPSPILSSIYRPSYMKSPSSETQNEIELWEINDKVKLVENPSLCHIYINVTRNLTNTIYQYSKELQNHILLTVVDNDEYSPSSTESTPRSLNETNESKQYIIKINSELSFQGINQFLKYDTEASSQYFQSLINSNIYDLMKCIGYYLHTESLSSWLMKNITSNMSRYDAEPDALTEIYSSLRSNVIPKFSNSVHSELQYKFVPKTDEYFKKLRWWKLYLKNDNVEYDLKDFFNENFMTSSIEQYNYLRGKIVSQIQQQKHVEYPNNTEISNPLLKMKTSLINDRIVTEIQPFVYNSISQAFIFYQLPLSVLSFLSYQYFEFTSSGAFAIALLGWVVGFNHVSKQWEKFNKSWLQDLYEDIRICIGKDCIENGLLTELNSRYSDERRLVRIKNEIVQGIRNSRRIDL